MSEKTGAGMMDCKKVLTETNGDEEKAIELLRERGIAKAAKKADRIASEGLVAAYVSEDKKVGAVVEVNAETDFVAKNEEFKQFVADVVKQVAEKNPADLEDLLAQTSIAEPDKTAEMTKIERIEMYTADDVLKINLKKIEEPLKIKLFDYKDEKQNEKNINNIVTNFNNIYICNKCECSNRI